MAYESYSERRKREERSADGAGSTSILPATSVFPLVMA